MISYRGYELSSGKELISTEKRRATDEKTLRQIGRTNLFLKKVLKKTKVVVLKLLDKVHDATHWTWVTFSRKVDQYFDKLRGRRGTGKRGIISLYYQESNREE